MIAHNYDIDAKEAKALLDAIDTRYADKNREPGEYVRGIKDALGWVLGYYEMPEIS